MPYRGSNMLVAGYRILWTWDAVVADGASLAQAVSEPVKLIDRTPVADPAIVKGGQALRSGALALDLGPC